jgi:hypothetical protein
MEHRLGTLEREENAPVAVLYGACELSNSTWKLAGSDGNKVRHVTVIAGDLGQMQAAFRPGRQGTHGELL